MISEFLDSREEDLYYKEFCYTLNQLLLLEPDNRHFKEILKLHIIEEASLLSELQIHVQKIDVKTLERTPSRSPNAIQDKPFLWLYYAAYHSIFYQDNILKKNKQLFKLIDLIFLFHVSYLKIIHTKQKDVLNRLENLALASTRVFETLIAFISSGRENLIDNYLLFHGNVVLNFIHSIKIESEQQKFLKVSNRLNYIQYNIDENTNIVIKSTRKVTDAASYLASIVDVKEMYQDFLSGDLEASKKRVKSEKSRIDIPKESDNGIDSSQDSVVCKELSVISDIRSEIIEQMSKPNITHRDVSEEGTGVIPNIYRQRLRNRAYSANVTKNNLGSSKSYDIPVKSLLREFIQNVFSSKIASEEEGVFRIIFVFGILTGQSYQRTIKILSQDFDEIKVNFEHHQLWTVINKGLFAKLADPGYFENNKKKVHFHIPYLLSLSLKRCAVSIQQSKMDFLTEETELKYHHYFDKKMGEFYKAIQINTKKIHRISSAYLKESGLEDITILFCTAIYSQNQTAKMAYASIHKNPEYYSEYVEKLYFELKMDKVLSSHLSLKSSIDSTRTKALDAKREYSGSNLLAQQQKIIDFFSTLYMLVQQHDSYMRFNYISIYVRYAMSLLAGTRGFLHSATLKDVSHVFKIMKITEKSETKISGLRVIPLCDTILKLIEFYERECQKYAINSNDFYIYYDDRFELFNVEKKYLFLGLDEMVVQFIENVPLNFGRHLFSKFAIERGLPRDYIDGYLGHYSAGLEQFGIYSSLDYPHYISSTRSITQMLADIHKVKIL